MHFSSPYNKVDPISPNKPEFNGMGLDGTVYKVREGFVPDKRRKSGQRLTRVDVNTDTCLLDIPLLILPDEYTSTESWLMLQVTKLLETNRELKDMVTWLSKDLEDLSRKVDGFD